MAPKHTLKQQLGAFLLIVVFAALGLPNASANELPDLGDRSDRAISPEMDAKHGRAFMQLLRQHLDIVEDDELNEYIHDLGHRLVSESGSDKTFHFFVVNDRAINAFAGPGGYIGIHTGLIFNSEYEDELASVLAHEIAHVTQQHLARRFNKASNLNLATAAALIAAIVLGGEAGQAALLATAAGAQQSFLNFSRAHEAEADRIGMQVLQQAGFDPRAMPAFFERLQQKMRFIDNSGTEFEFLRTHPVTTSRIADSRNRANRYPPRPLQHQNRFQLMKAKARLISYPATRESSAMLEQHTDDTSRYSYGLSLYQLKQYEEAARVFQKLEQSKPLSSTYTIALARALAHTSNNQKALPLLDQALALSPGNYSLLTAYSDILIQMERYQDAIPLLRQLQNHDLATPKLFKQLAQTENQVGNAIESHEAFAEYYYALGDLLTTMEHLKRALSFTDEQDIRRQRINTRLNIVKEEHLELKEENP